jgi:hypothetical protein
VFKYARTRAELKDGICDYLNEGAGETDIYVHKIDGTIILWSLEDTPKYSADMVNVNT